MQSRVNALQRKAKQCRLGAALGIADSLATLVAVKKRNKLQKSNY